MSEDKNFDHRLSDALKRNDLDLSEATGRVHHAPEEPGAEAEISSGLATGMRIGLEFMSGTVVGLLLGWALDSYFDTSPWGLLVLTVLGFAAGLLNVYRAVNNIDEGIGINRQNLRKMPEKAPENGLTKRK